MYDARIKVAAELDHDGARRLASSLQEATGEGPKSPLNFVLHELSATGFLIETSTAMEVGAIVSLELPGRGVTDGKIIWASGKFLGGNFLPAPDGVASRAGTNLPYAQIGERAGRVAAKVARTPITMPFNQPALVGDEIAFVRDSIRRGQLSGDGYYTKQCNAAIEEITQSPKALITHSCTAALEMAAILCDLSPGDEVIVPSFTFVSTANAIVMRGATPVFVDIDSRTLNIDPARVEAAITPRTKAIFAVHYAGFPPTWRHCGVSQNRMACC